jgi:hypothetical protein
MEEPIISKEVSTDAESGLKKRVDITSVNINLASKEVIIVYDVHLIGKTGKVVSTPDKGITYVRRNEPVVMGRRQVEGQPIGVTEEFELSPANPRFDNLVSSEVGVMIKAMLENDLDNYPNL